MTQNWEPGTQYNYGDVVKYNGHRYKIIQPHRSQGDWTPDVTPALWGRMQDEECDDKPQQQYQAPQQEHKHDTPQHGQQGQQYPTSEEEPEEKHGWAHGHKKELGLAGGLVAGAALLAGGVAAYKHHEHKKKETLDRDSWIEEATARTQAYNSGKGPRVAWVLTSGRNIPRGAIEGGRDQHGEVLYIARAFQGGGIHPGTACTVYRTGAIIGHRMKAHDVEEYEILVGEGSAVLWVDSRELGRPGAPHPVEGGHEDIGTPLYVAQAQYGGGYLLGKSGGEFDGAFITHGGKEVKVEKYSVLCYAR